MGIWLIPILLLLILIGTPISFALGITSLIGFIILDKLPYLTIIPQIMFSALNSFPLLAMPFFMLAGGIMNQSGITDRLIQLSNVLVGWLRGGLGHVNILASVFFAGITGSAVADTSSLGPLLIPAMEKSGYDRDYAAAITAASSVIGPIIPPSIIMVIYGTLMNVSIAGMFAAGLIPGILIALGLMGVNHFISKKRNYPKQQLPSQSKVVKSLLGGIIPLLTPIIILGGILSGIFTPTEASAVAVFYSLLVAFVIYRTLTLKKLYNIVESSFRLCGIVLIIVALGSVLAWLFAIDRIPEQLTHLLISISGDNKYIILLIINIFMLIVGMFMDITAALIILAPILAPLAINLGVDPLHFGIMMVVNLNIGLITPPLGAVLFVATSISKLKYENVIKEILPFLVVEIIILFLIVYIPELTLLMPHYLGFK